MKKIVMWPVLMLVTLLVSCNRSEKEVEYRLPGQTHVFGNVAEEIVYSHFKVEDVSWADLIAILETTSKANDPLKTGVRIVIPERFKERFEKEDTVKVTYSLGPQITFHSLILEIEPMEGWDFFPIWKNELHFIPVEAIEK